MMKLKTLPVKKYEVVDQILGIDRGMVTTEDIRFACKKGRCSISATRTGP